MTDDSSPQESCLPGARVLVASAAGPATAELLERLVRMGHHPALTPSADAAMGALSNAAPDLVLADARLEGLDGFAFCRTLKAHPVWNALPVVLFGDLDRPEDRIRCWDCGADDVVWGAPPADEVRARLDRVLQAGRAARAASARLDQTAARLGESEAAFQGAATALAWAGEAVDDASGNHVRRVGSCASVLADAVGLSAALAQEIGSAARLHDVGKMRISPSIVRKPGPLTVEEFDVIKNHTYHGAEILGGSPHFALAREIALCHHERWDGTGYPIGTRGTAIPLAARIASLADVYDSLRMSRPYRAALNHDLAFEIISRGDWRTSPDHFDPDVLEAFRRHHRRFEEAHASPGSQG